MPRRALRPTSTTPLGTLIWDAMQEVGRRRQADYTFMDLARDLAAATGREWSFGYLRNLANGLRVQPGREIIADLARVLPLDEQEALLAAGYVPAGLATIAGALARAEGLAASGPAATATLQQLMDELGAVEADIRRARATFLRLLAETSAPAPASEPSPAAV